jgi:hypothetical protein
MTDAATGSAQGNPSTTSTVVGGGSTSESLNTGAPAAAAPAAAPEWLKGADEVTVGYVQNKGWTEPTQVLEGYRNLEKLLGADKAGRAVVLPGDKAEPAEVAAFYEKLGRPADPKDYKIPVPEGYDPGFAEAAKAKFHELGITAKQAEGLAAWNNEYVQNLVAGQQNQTAEAFQKDVAALKEAWGAAHDQNVVVARNVVNALGWDAAKVDKLSAAIGHKELMQTLHQLGTKMGEDLFVGGKDNQYGGALTPAQAKARIQELRNDKAWTARYLNRDAEALAEMTKLQRYAFPE